MVREGEGEVQKGEGRERVRRRERGREGEREGEKGREGGKEKEMPASISSRLLAYLHGCSALPRSPRLSPFSSPQPFSLPRSSPCRRSMALLPTRQLRERRAGLAHAWESAAGWAGGTMAWARALRRPLQHSATLMVSLPTMPAAVRRTSWAALRRQRSRGNSRRRPSGGGSWHQPRWEGWGGRERSSVSYAT